MKITWDNIDEFKYINSNNFIKQIKNYKNAYYLIEKGCLCCKDPYFVQRHIYNKGKGRFCSHTCSMSGVYNSMHGVVLEDAPSWRGGVKQLKLTSYDTYSSDLGLYGVSCRKSPDDENILEVRCTYCNKWYRPSISSSRSKISSIKGISSGENNLYCSDGCKKSCGTYRKIKYQEGFKTNTSREVQPALRKLVLERDDWRCQKCDNENELHCHHYEGIEVNPV